MCLVGVAERRVRLLSVVKSVDIWLFSAFAFCLPLAINICTYINHIHRHKFINICICASLFVFMLLSKHCCFMSMRSTLSLVSVVASAQTCFHLLLLSHSVIVYILHTNTPRAALTASCFLAQFYFSHANLSMAVVHPFSTCLLPFPLLRRLSFECYPFLQPFCAEFLLYITHIYLSLHLIPFPTLISTFPTSPHFIVPTQFAPSHVNVNIFPFFLFIFHFQSLTSNFINFNSIRFNTFKR